MRIIIVAGDKNVSDEVKRCIPKSGSDIVFDVENSVLGGLEKIETQSYDFIFLDYHLKDGDGITLLKQIFNQETSMVAGPVIMMTRRESESAMGDAMRYGAMDYILKDMVSRDTLTIAMQKAKELYDLRKTRNHAKKQLLHTQKMEAIGQLTGGIAHDFNNILTIILGHTRLLDECLSDIPTDIKTAVQSADAIKRATNRGVDLIKRLMMFSRLRSLDPMALKLEVMLDEIKGFLKSTLGETIEINIHAHDDLWPVLIDQAQFEHAIINMAVNARDAMPNGGKLTFEIENMVVENDWLPDMSDIPAGEYVLLTVSDNGQGMDEETCDKIFDPFFTTKDVDKGTGLGLSMVYGLVKESGGYIHVYSERGKGTSFRIYIPRTTIEAKKNHHVFQMKEAAGGEETILVVEDETEILKLTSNMLRSKGYNVIEATNGSEALNIVKRDGSNIDLLFTDISMPGDMNGIQTAARALALNPDINVLFTTGFTKQSLPDYGLIEGSFEIISKPYQNNNLMQKIRDVLDQKMA